MESVKPVLLRLVPWTALSLAAGIAYGLSGMLAGAALVALAESLQYLRETRAMRSAQEMALARRTSEAEATAARLTEIEKQLKLLATPEKLAMFEKFAEHAKRFGLGRLT